MFECKQFVVLLTLVPHPKVDGGAVRCGGKHHLCHHSRNVDLLMPYPDLWWSSLLGVSRNFLLPLKVIRHSILLLVLLPRVF